jgi:uncharacterized integral membrane protein
MTFSPSVLSVRAADAAFFLYTIITVRVIALLMLQIIKSSNDETYSYSFFFSSSSSFINTNELLTIGSKVFR